MSIAALFRIAKTWKKPKCALTDEWIRSCGIYIYKWNIIHPLKRMEYYSAIKRMK